MQGLGCSFVEDLLLVKGFNQSCCEDCSKEGLGLRLSVLDVL